MALIQVVPTVLIHQIDSGGALTGVAPTGTAPVDSGETILRGRYRKYSDLSDGGLVEISESVAARGFSIRSVLINIAGITACTFSVVDRDGMSVSAGSATISSGAGYSEWINDGLLVAPGCKFKAVGTGTASSDGEIMFIIGGGWGRSVFDYGADLGSSSLPPGK